MKGLGWRLFFFGDAISEFEKRGSKAFNGNINLDIYL